MAKAPYKFSTALLGHTSDVRAVATFTDGTIVSTSRDKTACVWKPSGNGKDYTQTAVLRGHTNFVSAVCVLNPTESNPEGYIITGSNDNTICIYNLDRTKPLHVIEAHKNTVCNLRSGKNEGTFLSSSWDLTAKLWNMNDLSKPWCILTGHTAAVWCVADLVNGDIVTGSADKLVIVWTKDGVVRHKLSGHKDCIRDVVAIKDDEFLTCANDATVCHWNSSSGTCLGSYCGHENYIYSIAAMLNGTYVFTSGEDQTIRVWLNGEIDQTIYLPTDSVWCIDLLPNGDIVAGSSDSTIRIFSADPARYASNDVLQIYEEEVAKVKINAQEQLGGLKIKDLPDAKALQQPGQKDGQTKMINEGNAIKAYSWSQKEQKWILIGDVMSASGGSTATSGKQLYNGIEYDYVFSVDIQDGIPPLKLPYNNGQDPWHVAQKFLHDNDLSQLFLDQVANFIVKNSQTTPVLNTEVQYADPFTGGSRYIPGSGTEENTTDISKSNVSAPSNISVSTSYIPQTRYLKLEQANLFAISDKLRELNSKQENIHQISDEKLDMVIKLVGNEISETLRLDAINVLKSLLNWPHNIIFPVLDIARLAVLQEKVNEQLCSNYDLLAIIKKQIQPDALPSNQMLTFRLMANLFYHEKGEKFCLNCKDEVLKALLDLNSLGNKHNQVAISTYMLNLIVAFNKYNDMPGRTKSLNVMFVVLPRLNESEAIFRALVGLGTLLAANIDTNDHSELIKAVRQSESALSVLRRMSESSVGGNTENKIASCSKQIIDLIV